MIFIKLMLLEMESLLLFPRNINLKFFKKDKNNKLKHWYIYLNLKN
jgi:hypothetical protein